MPSGHTTAAFAAASAATAEVGAHWPRHRTAVGITLYTAAGLVGLSRMYNNQHWASDVVVGAAVGTFSGWKVVGYTHAHPNNPVDRILLGTRVAPSPTGGVTLTWSSLQR
jgi:membrane-associated phospholipid phosphatase